MLETASQFIKYVYVVFGLAYVLRIYYQSKREHPVFPYREHSSANTADWRWRKPEPGLNLRLEDGADRSCLYTPFRHLDIEKIFIVIGYLGVAMTFYLIAVILNRGSGWPEFVIAAMFMALAFAMLHVGARVSSLTLYLDHLVIEQRYAFFLRHLVVIRHHPKLVFTGKPQSLFELNTEQTEPEYKLYIKKPRRFIFSSQQRFFLAINQSQGSWLLEGLQYWRDHAGLPTSDTPRGNP